MLRAIDLCCGAGGWACAAQGLPVEWVAVADHAADCLETWALNHGTAHPECQLIQADLATKQGMGEVLKAVKGRGVNLVLGAIPCEQVSSARGNRPLLPGELEGVHALIDQCFAAVKRLRPRWWCFEDVTAIEGHLPPPLVSPVPYECRRINASLYGPQKRLRTFFGRFPELAAPKAGPRVLADVLRPGPYRTLPELSKYQRSNSKWYAGDRIAVQDPARASFTVVSSQGGRGSRQERSGMVPLARVQDAGQPCPTVADFGSWHERAALVGAQARNQGATVPAPAVTDGYRCDERTVPLEPRGREKPADPAAPGRAVINGKTGEQAMAGDGLVRVLEWQEAALLQGFPPDYVFAASWSRTWKLVAQAIPIQVGRAILQGIVAARCRRGWRSAP